jgi:hypothetical protein
VACCRSPILHWGSASAINLELLIPAIILAPCAAFGLAMLPRIWTAREDRPAPSPRRLRSFRDARQEAYARSLPLAIVALTALVVSMSAVVLQEATSGTLSDGAGEVALWAFTAFAACTLLAVSVVLFNFPKFVVPPATRDELGAVELWWRGRRTAR